LQTVAQSGAISVNKTTDGKPSEHVEHTRAWAIGWYLIAWRHKGLMAIGVVIGVMVALVVGLRMSPVYRSSSKVLVVKKRPDAVIAANDPRSVYLEDYLSTHAELIRNPIIVEKAVEKHNLGTLESFRDCLYPTGEILNNLRATRILGENRAPTNILVLSYSGPVATDCPIILEAVFDAYRDFLGKEYQTVSDDTVTVVKKARSILEEGRKKAQDSLTKIRLEHPGLRRTSTGTTSVADRIATIEGKLSALTLKQTELMAKLRDFEVAIRENRPRIELLAMAFADQNSRGGTGLAAHEMLLAKRLEYSKLVNNDALGPDHPKVKGVKDEIDLISDHLKKTQSEDPLGTLAKDPVEAYQLGLKRDLSFAESQIKAFGIVLSKELEVQKQLTAVEQEEETLRGDLERQNLLYEQLVKQLSEMKLLTEHGGFKAVTIAAPGDGAKVAPQLPPILLVGALIGLMGGIGLAYIAHWTDLSFRTPDDVRRQLALPLVGHIPSFNARSAQANGVREDSILDPSILVHHRSKSREAESFRGVRTALFFSARAKSVKIVQVTSPNSGDGKTTTAANLAVSIAQSEKKVIIVDADLRRPRIHRLFGLANERGLSNILTGDAELQQVVQETEVPGLHVLTTGGSPPNPAELLVLPRFKELLEQLRREYEFVVIDSPPLLAVTDPCTVATHVDGVFLVIRLSKNARPNALRAREILAALGVSVIGAIVNGVSTKRGSGYGTYGYGYGYGDSYGYGRDYSDSGDSYYSSSEETGAFKESNGNGSAIFDRDAHSIGENRAMMPGRGGRRRHARKGLLAWLFQR
jgi:polysaccharide biosynthesis transport protein